MNKFMVALVVAIGVLAVGAGSYVLFSRAENKDSMEITEQNPDQSGEKSNQMSLRDLLLMSNIQQCKFSDSTDSTETSGTVYVGGGKMRGDFTTTANSESVNAHVVVDGETSYVWVDGQSTGYKSSLENLEDAASESSEDIDLYKPVDFSCTNWNVDNSKFEVPGNIEFIDIGEVMKNMGVMEDASDSGSVKALQCSTCESLPEEAQAQCRVALGC